MTMPNVSLNESVTAYHSGVHASYKRGTVSRITHKLRANVVMAITFTTMAVGAPAQSGISQFGPVVATSA